VVGFRPGIVDEYDGPNTLGTVALGVRNGLVVVLTLWSAMLVRKVSLQSISQK
jgi:hypothetical protein